jgi:hypothetical protein
LFVCLFVVGSVLNYEEEGPKRTNKQQQQQQQQQGASASELNTGRKLSAIKLDVIDESGSK